MSLQDMTPQEREVLLSNVLNEVSNRVMADCEPAECLAILSIIVQISLNIRNTTKIKARAMAILYEYYSTIEGLEK